MRLIVTFFLASLAIAPIGPARAGPDESNSAAPDRYTLRETANGWLRLDRETGLVSLCRAKYGGWICAPVPDATQVYEAEAKALQEERDRLKARVSQLEARLEAAGGNAPGDTEANDPNETAPPKAAPAQPLITPEEERELDRFMAFSERAMRRFFGMVKMLRREFDDRI
ncbi:hypothetical protein [Breoghania sp.]|uniref:hypothetical protein n=1 Tax=Breoghania sp. TaxID=2065378 RepID=UPI002AA6F8AF|nr:hypothetical protein [Breoghania sp.]